MGKGTDLYKTVQTNLALNEIQKIIKNPKKTETSIEFIKNQADFIEGIYAYIKKLINEHPEEITEADKEELLLFGVFLLSQDPNYFTEKDFGTIEKIQTALKECLKEIRDSSYISPYSYLINNAENVFNDNAPAANIIEGITTGTAAAIGKIPKNGINSFDPIIDKTFCEMPLNDRNLINKGAFAINVTSDADKKKNISPVLVKVELKQKLAEIETDPSIKIQRQDGKEEAFSNLSPELKMLFMALWAINIDSGKEKITRVTPDIICNTLYRSTGSTGTNQIAKMFKLLKTLKATTISIDNAQEAAAYPSKEKVTLTDVTLLNYFCEIRENAFGKKTTEIYYERSMVWDFIERRGHFTTPPLTITKPYLNLTNFNAALEDYIKGRIAQMKRNSKYIKKIRYETLYKKLSINDRLKKSRLRSRTEEVLKALKVDKYIKNFKIYPNKTKPEGIEIIL